MRWWQMRDRVAREAAERLVDRIAALTRREEEVSRAAAETEERGRELDRREAELERRLAALTRRELALARRVAAAGLRERARAGRGAAAHGGAPEQDGVAASAVAADGARRGSRYNLQTLERLVERRGVEFPDRVEEWSDHLFFLRDYADPDGALPPDFDWLVQDTFEELLG